MKHRRGFTLIELLVFALIFSLVMAGFITMLVSVARVGSRQVSASDVTTQGQFLLQQLQYYIQSARLVDMTQDSTVSTLTLREATSTITTDPISITLSSGTVYLQQGTSGALQPLTSNKVSVSNLSFTRHYSLSGSSTAYGTESVSYSFTVTGGASNTRQFYSQSFQSSAAVLQPVPKIALIQQGSASNNGSNITTITSTYPTSNETGDLLIGVISNTGTSTATTSLSQVGSTTWTQIANPKFAAYNQEISIYDVVNYNPGLVGWWKLDEGSGSTTADSSGNGNVGTLTNSPTWTTSGKYNDALVFTYASNNYVDVANPANFAFERTQPFTLAAWVYRTSAAVEGDIISKMVLSGWTGYDVDAPANGANSCGAQACTTNNCLVMDVNNSAGGNNACVFVNNSGLTLNAWHHVVATYDGSSTAAGIHLYVDGVAQTATRSQSTLTASILTATDLKIGTDVPGSSGFTGTIDDARVYNRALSADEVLGLYANTGPTVTATFSKGVSSPSLFLYEYRGAATSSPFDASSTQTQSNTANPSSGFANANSSVELLFGTLYSNPSTETPAAGSGFTTEATSSVSATFIEDENVYVTGPVSTNWTYSQTTPSSSATIVTFK